MDNVKGYLEIFPKGFGFLRQAQNNFRASNEDTFVSPVIIRNFFLKEGMFIEGTNQIQKDNKVQLGDIHKINGWPPAEVRRRPELKDQVSISPDEKFNLCLGKRDFLGKILNFATPSGKGQRGMIISAPKTGKTTILKQYAKAIQQNHPEVKLYILLVDERPEEVTDFRRSLESACVLSSSADESSTNHLRLTRLTMAAAMREAETGKDVIILIDSLTRMARAFNKEANSHGRTLSGGLAANALELPRRFFGGARNIENGGSLTIIASILVDTGSRMDEVIFQEFKGTGNLDLVLSQACAEQRLFPAVDINASGTRKEELLMPEEQHHKAMKLRRFLSQMKETEAMQYLRNHDEVLKDFEQ